MDGFLACSLSRVSFPVQPAEEASAWSSSAAASPQAHRGAGVNVDGRWELLGRVQVPRMKVLALNVEYTYQSISKHTFNNNTMKLNT